MFFRRTNKIIIGTYYTIVKKNEIPENGTIGGFIVFINEFFKSGKVFIFDNTQSFVLTNNGIFRFYYKNSREIVEEEVEYELYTLVDFC